jgi:tetratricopeptide (TPR) repeat protein
MSYDDLEAGFLEADYLMQVGNYGAAIKLLLKYRKKFSENSLISFNLGVLYYKYGKFTKSVYSLEEAVNLGAEEPEVYNQLGLASDKIGDIEGARAYYKKALEIDTSFSMAWNNLGVTYFISGDYLSARTYFENAISVDDTDPDTWYNIRDTYIELGLKEEADFANEKYRELLRH